MELTQIIAVVIAFGMVLAVALMVRRQHDVNPQERYLRDVKALQRGRRARVIEGGADDVWSAGTETHSTHSRSEKAAAWVALGALGGCGGCGGCGCGG